MSFVSEKLPGTKIGKRSELTEDGRDEHEREGLTGANGRLVPPLEEERITTVTQSCDPAADNKTTI